MTQCRWTVELKRSSDVPVNGAGGGFIAAATSSCTLLCVESCDWLNLILGELAPVM